MKGVVYKIVDKSNDNVFYVGSTFRKDIRFKTHYSSIMTSPDDLYKYIRINKIEISIEVLETISKCNKNYLRRREYFWINNYIDNGVKLVNKISKFDKSKKVRTTIKVDTGLLKKVRKHISGYGGIIGGYFRTRNATRELRAVA